MHSVHKIVFLPVAGGLEVSPPCLCVRVCARTCMHLPAGKKWGIFAHARVLWVSNTDATSSRRCTHRLARVHAHSQTSTRVHARTFANKHTYASKHTRTHMSVRDWNYVWRVLFQNASSATEDVFCCHNGVTLCGGQARPSEECSHNSSIPVFFRCIPEVEIPEKRFLSSTFLDRVSCLDISCRHFFRVRSPEIRCLCSHFLSYVSFGYVFLSNVSWIWNFSWIAFPVDMSCRYVSFLHVSRRYITFNYVSSRWISCRYVFFHYTRYFLLTCRFAMLDHSW